MFKHRRLDQLIEGSPSVLIEHGRIKSRTLAKELLTESELLTMAHRQGFSTLEEVDTCVLEPGGTFFIQGKVPRVSDRQHAEILAKLEHLERLIDHLRHHPPR